MLPAAVELRLEHAPVAARDRGRPRRRRSRCAAAARTRWWSPTGSSTRANWRPAAAVRGRARHRLRGDRRAARARRGPAGQPPAGHGLLRRRPPRGRGPHDPAARRATTRSRRASAGRAGPADEPPGRALAGAEPGGGRRSTIGPDFDDPELDKDLWRFRRIAARGLFEPGAYPSDITLVNWPQIDYPDEVVLDGRAAGARELSLSFLHWMQTEGGFPGLRLRGDVIGDTPDGLAKHAYIREPRRLRAVTTVVEQDLIELPRASPTASASARTASTCTRRPAATPTSTSPAHPFEIPLGALVPQRVREPGRRRQGDRDDPHHQRRLPAPPGGVERGRGGRAPGGALRGAEDDAVRGAGGARELQRELEAARRRARLARTRARRRSSPAPSGSRARAAAAPASRSPRPRPPRRARARDAIDTTDATIAASCDERPRLATNERSILIVSIGKSLRCWKDE